MRRGMVLGLLLALGGLAAVKAQQPPADAPKVIDVEKVKDNLYVFRGGGGNTAVFLTANGVVVVDAKNPGWGTPILNKIKELTPKPVTMLINTHTHGDHVSGNVEFPATIDFIAQENTKANMEKMPIFKEHNGVGMAKRTFKDRMTIGKGADQIDLYYFGPGHTNGDAWVVFPALRIVHAGDIFANKGIPLIDSDNGGSVLHIHESLTKAYNGIKNVDTIINGHTPKNTTWADLKEFADFNHDFLTWAQAGLQAGKTPQQLADDGWKVPEKYAGSGYQPMVQSPKTPPATPPLFGGLAGRIATLQKEMKRIAEDSDFDGGREIGGEDARARSPARCGGTAERYALRNRLRFPCRSRAETALPIAAFTTFQRRARYADVNEAFGQQIGYRRPRSGVTARTGCSGCRRCLVPTPASSISRPADSACR